MSSMPPHYKEEWKAIVQKARDENRFGALVHDLNMHFNAVLISNIGKGPCNIAMVSDLSKALTFELIGLTLSGPEESFQ